MTSIAILRCGKFPSFVNWEIPNLDELFEEDHLLIRELKAQGYQSQSVVWSQPDTDWNQFDIALIRSTWDYLDEQEQFLQVLSQIESSPCELFNPVAAVRWNIDKRYLFDLKEWGVPVIPTFLASNVEAEALQKLLGNGQGQSIVLKPTVGLGASHSYHIQAEELHRILATLKTSQPHHEYLVQPFIESITTEGEWSFVYFNQKLSHVLLKKPAPGDYRVQGIYGGTVQKAEPRPNDLLQAEAVIAKIPFDILYARLDFVRVGDQLNVIEIELIEPIFSFNLAPESILRFINAVRDKFERHS